MALQVAPQIQETISINLNYLRLKRLVDILFTLLILPFLIIITIIVAVMIRLDSPGPIFFRQKRVGLNGDVFDIIKFRSMHLNSDDSTHREAIAKYMNGQKVSDTTDSELSYKQV